MPRQVCIAVDRSQTSQNALKWAAKAMVNDGDKVRLFTVLHPSPESELVAGVGAGAGGARTAPISVNVEPDAADHRQSMEFLEECKQKMVAEGVRAHMVSADALVAMAGTSGDIGREITSHAESCGCESLVMGSRGLGMSKKALMGLLGIGSVSDYVLKHAPCNVVLYKDKPAVRAQA